MSRSSDAPARNFDEGAGTYYGELDPKSRRNGYGHVVYEGEGNRYQGGHSIDLNSLL